MTRYELEYLIALRGDSIVETLSLIMSLQLAMVVAIYYLNGIRDLLIRHAVLVLYTLALTIASSKTFMDLSVIGAYTKEMISRFPETHDLNIGVMRLPEYTAEFFLAGIIILYVLLWMGTIYFLYFHDFADEEKSAATRLS